MTIEVSGPLVLKINGTAVPCSKDVFQALLAIDDDNIWRDLIEVGSHTVHGYTALHLAAQCGPLEAVTRLVAAGADIEAHDIGGRTALEQMKMFGSAYRSDLSYQKSVNPIINFLQREGDLLHARKAEAMSASTPKPQKP